MHRISRMKAVSCVIRRPENFNLSLEEAIAVNESPRAGDIAFVRCLSSDGCVTQIEDQQGAMVRLYKGDVFVAVLADRKSGYSTSAELPRRPVAKGDVLGLIFTNGLAGIPIFVPPYIGKAMMPLEVLGFARGKKKQVANLADAAPADLAEWGMASPRTGRMLFIVGTSAECGKTTFTANLNLAIKRRCPELKTAGIKACGTGHSRDKRSMLDANYDCAVDFVDFGLSTTYEVPTDHFGRVLTAMLNFAQAQSDIVVTEIGGDFLEANAPEVLRLLTSLSAQCVLLVNDAMGALEALRRLEKLEVKPIAVSCFKQNLVSLRARVAAEGYDNLNVMDNRDEAAMDDLSRAFVSSIFGVAGNPPSVEDSVRAAA
jgi:hypothetical protein